MQGQRVNGDIGAPPGYPHQHHPALGVGELVAQLNHRWRSGVVDEHIQGLLPQGCLDGGPRIPLAAVDRVGGPELPRQGQPAVKEVDRDDRPGCHQGSSLHDVEANTPCAKHHHSLAKPQTGIVFHHPKPRGDGTAKQGRNLRLGAGGHLGAAVLAHHRMAVEGGDPARIERLAPPAVLRRIRLDASPGPPVQHHLIARLHLLHPRADRQHRGRSLMAHQMGQVGIGALDPRNLPQLGAADATHLHLHQHLTHIELLGQLDGVHHQGLVLGHQNGGLGDLGPCDGGPRAQGLHSLKIDEGMIAAVAGLLKPPLPGIRGVEGFTGHLPIQEVGLLSLVAPTFNAQIF